MPAARVVLAKLERGQRLGLARRLDRARPWTAAVLAALGASLLLTQAAPLKARLDLAFAFTPSQASWVLAGMAADQRALLAQGSLGTLLALGALWSALLLWTPWPPRTPRFVAHALVCLAGAVASALAVLAASSSAAAFPQALGPWIPAGSACAVLAAASATWCVGTVAPSGSRSARRRGAAWEWGLPLAVGSLLGLVLGVLASLGGGVGLGLASGVLAGGACGVARGRGRRRGVQAPTEPEQEPQEPAKPETPPLLDLVHLPSGTFRLGSPTSEVGRFPNEGPIENVALEGFAIGRTTVTRGQWRSVMETEPSAWQRDPGAVDEERRPANNVSWYEALDLCNALSRREGLEEAYRIERDEAGKVVGVEWRRESEGYRLPTEAEWEYAARAGSTTRYPWGDDESGRDAHAWWSQNSGYRVHPVGERKRTAGACTT